MSKFAKTPTKNKSAIKTSGERILTHEGNVGYKFDAKSELFLTAAVNMVSEDTFYESGADRDERFKKLIHKVAEDDPEWVARFIPFLRTEMFMRSASVMATAEFARATHGKNIKVTKALTEREANRIDEALEREQNKDEPDVELVESYKAQLDNLKNKVGNHSLARYVIANSLYRADEPSELLAYWLGVNGRPILNVIKRGVADAIIRLYTPRNAIKYDGTGQAWRLADAINLVKPQPKDKTQAAVFKWLLDRRYDNVQSNGSYMQVETIANYEWLNTMPDNERYQYLVDNQAKVFQDSGMTWEKISSWAGKMDAQVWEKIIPSMGYMALLRNLRNFDKVGISDDSKQYVINKISDPKEVARSMQFPFRFLSAWLAVEGFDWGSALEKALDYSTQNIPEFPGRTLVLTDSSGSMGQPISDRSSVQRQNVAAVIAASIAKRGNDVDLVSYASHWEDVPINRGQSVLRVVERLAQRNGAVGHGTETFQALNANYNGHDRVVIVSDMQAHPGGLSPAIQVPVYTYDVGGYGRGHLPVDEKQFYTFGGFSDVAFKMMALIEKGRSANWPF